MIGVRTPRRRSKPIGYRPLITLIATLSLIATGAGCNGGARAPSPTASTATSGDVCQGTHPGGQVVVYSVPGLEYWFADLLFNFEHNCGVTVFRATGSGAQIGQRLEAERPNPLADIVIAESPQMATLAGQGLLDGTNVPSAASVPNDRCDRQRRWCSIVEDYTSWVFNPELLSPPPQRPPQKWDDLLDGRFHQNLLTSRPDQAVAGLGMLELLSLTLDKDGALAYMGQLERNVSAHYVNTDTMSRVVAGGGALAASGTLHEDLNDIDQYHNLSLWFPAADASARTTLAIPFGASLVHGGPGRDNASALLSYMWSKEGQGYVGQVYGAPARPDVIPTDQRSARLRAALAGVRVLRIDWELAAQDQQSMVNRWIALRMAPDGTAPPSVTPPAPPPVASPAPSSRAP